MMSRNATLGPPPFRRANSVRRTLSIQSCWPQELAGPQVMKAAGRDLFTGVDKTAPQAVEDDALTVTLSPGSRIEAITGSRLPETLANFVGKRPGGELRRAMGETMPDDVAQSTILHGLLDNLAGGLFMSKASWYAWLPGGTDDYDTAQGLPSTLGRSVEGLCISFQSGSPAMTADGLSNEAIADHPLGPPPFGIDDPWEWHIFPATPGPNQWRLRRIDLWREDGAFHVDSWFQDSAALPGRQDLRLLFHEYALRAVVDPDTLSLLSIDVTPAVLPFDTCPAAAASPQRLVGASLARFRELVPATLPGIQGCTHLNDMLRTLQDVEPMAALLEARLAAQP